MGAASVRYIVELAGRRHEVVVAADGGVVADGRRREASLVAAAPGEGWSLLLDGASLPLFARASERGQWEIALDGRAVSVQVLEAREARIRERTARAAGRAGLAPLRAPMPGLVVRLAAREGDVVEPGDAILMVEAMKMENELRAAAAARVVRILVSPGDAVEKAQVLAEFEEVQGK